MSATSPVQARESTSETVTWLENEFERVWRVHGRRELMYRHGSLMYTFWVTGMHHSDISRPPMIGLKPDGLEGWCR